VGEDEPVSKPEDELKKEEQSRVDCLISSSGEMPQSIRNPFVQILGVFVVCLIQNSFQSMIPFHRVPELSFALDAESIRI
jgi:hypothetical protein